MTDQNTGRILRHIQGLIEQKEYAEARRLLKKLDHPTATKWLERLDEIDPQPEEKYSVRRIVSAVVVSTLIVCGTLSLFALAIGDSPTTQQNSAEIANAEITVTTAPTATSTVAPTPTPTLTSIQSRVIWYESPKTWYSQGANFRSCPDLSDDCDEGRILLTGQPVVMLGEIEGETWLDSRTWYFIEVGGDRGFVHSTFITEGIDRPTATPAPPILYYSSDDSSSRGGSGGGVSSGGTTGVSCPSLNYTCGQLSSCDMAYACLAAGNDSLDGNNNGIPCEDLCGG